MAYETGLCERKYSLDSIIATSEWSFTTHIYRIHPSSTPEKYFEIFMNKDYNTYQETWCYGDL